MISAACTETVPADGALAELVGRLRSTAIRALRRMYRPEERLFAFRLRRQGQGVVLEGTSRRYTAVVLIGLAGEPEGISTDVLAGQSPRQPCDRLLDEVETFQDLGEVSLTIWAARALDHPVVPKAIDRLKRMDPVQGPWPTVELAWALTALTVDGGEATNMALAGEIARRLLSAFHQKSGLFPHWPAGANSSLLRPHVACFADFVYPIQALSYYHLATGDAEALEAARRCAGRMCDLQGPAGQWWWHFDVRSGRVLERFPVYAVHQDSMAPMALFALRQARGEGHVESIDRGLRWLSEPPELPCSLMDTDADVIWRKVARYEPGKVVRGLQAAVSRLHPSLRAPGMDLLFPPGWVDYESRPYHMGWILHAWPAGRLNWPVDG